MGMIWRCGHFLTLWGYPHNDWGFVGINHLSGCFESVLLKIGTMLLSVVSVVNLNRPNLSVYIETTPERHLGHNDGTIVKSHILTNEMASDMAVLYRPISGTITHSAVSGKTQVSCLEIGLNSFQRKFLFFFV